VARVEIDNKHHRNLFVYMRLGQHPAAIQVGAATKLARRHLAWQG
jgi:hypothetical protein